MDVRRDSPGHPNRPDRRGGDAERRRPTIISTTRLTSGLFRISFPRFSRGRTYDGQHHFGVAVIGAGPAGHIASDILSSPILTFPSTCSNGCLRPTGWFDAVAPDHPASRRHRALYNILQRGDIRLLGNVDDRLGCDLGREMHEHCDAIIVATGAADAPLDIPGVDLPRLCLRRRRLLLVRQPSRLSPGPAGDRRRRPRRQERALVSQFAKHVQGISCRPRFRTAALKSNATCTFSAAARRSGFAVNCASTSASSSTLRTGHDEASQRGRRANDEAGRPAQWVFPGGHHRLAPRFYIHMLLGRRDSRRR